MIFPKAIISHRTRAILTELDKRVKVDIPHGQNTTLQLKDNSLSGISSIESKYLIYMSHVLVNVYVVHSTISSSNMHTMK
jgi:hypothetical protein